MCSGGHLNLSYATMYNEAYNSENKKDWLSKELKQISENGACLKCRNKHIKYMNIAFSSQSIFEDARDDTTLKNMLRRTTQYEKSVLRHRLKRMSRIMLRHAYRPHGISFYRSMSVGLCGLSPKRV